MKRNNVVRKPRSKYRNTPTTVDGIRFDSKAESRRYGELKLLEKSGVISDLRLQPRYELQGSFRRGGRTVRNITYVADFAYTEKGREVVEDVKGKETVAFRLKQKMFWKTHPELELRIVKAR